MTWTMPAAAVTGNTLTAAFWNAQVRDNMLETAAATAAAAGDIVYADAANSMGSRLAHPGQSRMLVSAASSGLVWRQPAEDINYSDGSTSGGFNSTSYTATSDTDPGGFDLPAVTVTTGTLAVVIFGCRLASNSTGGAAVDMSYSISGASTSAATSSRSTRQASPSSGDIFTLSRAVLQSLTAGSNTFQVEALVSGGTGTIQRPYIVVQPY